MDHSPYATRVRMQITKKQLDIAIEPPPVPIQTPEFMARFPLGKIPVLELDDGSQIPDSWAIMEYLEDVSPAVSLRPEGATARAHMPCAKHMGAPRARMPALPHTRAHTHTAVRTGTACGCATAARHTSPALPPGPPGRGGRRLAPPTAGALLTRLRRGDD